MHRSNATGLIDRLEHRGLIRRRATPGDRRAYRVVLTPAARRLVAGILPGYYRLAEQVWDDLPVGARPATAGRLVPARCQPRRTQTSNWPHESP